MSIEGAERKLRPDLNINNNSLGDKTTNQNIMIVFKRATNYEMTFCIHKGERSQNS